MHAAAAEKSSKRQGPRTKRLGQFAVFGPAACLPSSAMQTPDARQGAVGTMMTKQTQKSELNG